MFTLTEWLKITKEARLNSIEFNKKSKTKHSTHISNLFFTMKSINRKMIEDSFARYKNQQ